MPNAIDLSGQRFERLFVVGPKKKNKHGGLCWLCRCDCGRAKWVNSSALRSGATKSCGCLHREKMTLKGLKSMAGQRVGKLTVLNEWKKDGSVIKWKCECDCGRLVWKPGQALRDGTAKSCGCVPRKTSNPLIDLTGKKFGRWLVVGPRKKINGVPCWFCRCDCGKEGWPSGQSLREEKSKSCGCLTRESTSKRFLKNLSGMRFGRLVVSEQKMSKNDVVYWWCRCDCGLEKWIGAPALRSGATQSCGCLNRELTGRRAQKLRKRYRVILEDLQRKALEAELARGVWAAERALELKAILLADEGPSGPSLSDTEIADKLGVTRFKAEYIRMTFAAPEVVKKRMQAALEKARHDPRARALRLAARKRYDQKPETREKKRAYQKNLPPEVMKRKKEREKAYRMSAAGRAAREREKLRAREFGRTPEGKAKKRMYFQRYKTKINERYKKRYETDPQFKIAVVLRKRVVLALKTRGVSKSRSLRELLGCSIPELKQHLESQFRSGMSWDNHGEWHVDHIRPCAAFDLTRVVEQKVCFHYTNLQPLWAEENLRKGDKILL